MPNQHPAKRSFVDSEDYVRRSVGRDRVQDESDEQDEVEPADEDDELPGQLKFPDDEDEDDDQ